MVFPRPCCRAPPRTPAGVVVRANDHELQTAMRVAVGDLFAIQNCAEGLVE